MPKRHLTLIGLGILVAGTVAGLLLHARQPHWHGHSLSHWLIQYRDWNGTTPAMKAEAAEAVRNIGTNALPWLLKWVVHEEEPAWKGRFAMWLTRSPKVPAKLQSSRACKWICWNALWPCRPSRRDRCALTGFEILGRKAAPAIQPLAQMLKDAKTERMRFRICFCLASTGEESLDQLILLSKDPNPAIAELGRNALLEIGQRKICNLKSL